MAKRQEHIEDAYVSKQVYFDLRPVNDERLHEELTAALGEGVSVSKGGRSGKLWVNFPAVPSEWQRQIAAQVLADHDETVQTAGQVREAARRAVLAELEPLVQAMDVTKPLKLHEQEIVARWMAAKFR